MKRISVIGLCLAAMFAFGAVAAGTASANPEFVGKAGVTEVKVKGTSNTTAVLQTVGGTKVECVTAGGVSAVLVAALVLVPSMLVDGVVFIFHNCKLVGGGTCTTTGEPAGLIKTTSLMGTLGYIKNEEKPPVGLLLEPTTGTLLAEFECESIIGKVKIEVTGGVIGEVTSELNKQLTKAKFTFVQTSGKQAIQTLKLLTGSPTPLFMEKVHLTSKSALGTEEAGQSGEGEVTAEPAGETVEIKG